MATQPLPSKGTAGPASDPGIQELARFIRRASGKFALIVAQCDRADYRDHCIRHLTQEFAPAAATVPLGTATDPLIPARKAAQQGATLLHLTDLELAVPEDQTNLAPIRHLNLHRGDWPALACPVILWVTDYLLGILLRNAPDFTDWRSGTVLLTPPEQTPATLAAQPTKTLEPQQDHRDDLEYNTAEERQARTAELIARLAPSKTEQGIADATDHIQALWMRELAVHLIHLGSRHEAAPWGDAALHYWEKARQLRELAYTHWEFAVAYEQIGQLALAIPAAERALSLCEQILEEQPSPQAARDVSVSLNKLGD